MEPVQDLYATLGLTASASHDEIRRAYRKRARRFHPDLAPAEVAPEFYRLTAAYQILGNPEKRAIYDIERLRYIATVVSERRHVFEHVDARRHPSDTGEVRPRGDLR